MERNISLQISQSTDRSLENVGELLGAAKLQESDLLPTSQAIFFSSSKDLHNQNLKFLELNNQLLQELKAGQHVCIKGDDEENAVLCTDTHTYDVSLTQTSNSLLLVKDLLYFKNRLLNDEGTRNVSKLTVSSIFYDYLEVTPGKPHLIKLNRLLEKALYKGPEQEYLIKKEDLLSEEDLENSVQSSKEELKRALSSFPIAKIEGKMRLLDFEYHFRVLSYMLKLIDENSWGLDEIDYEQTIASLSDLVPTPVLNAIFDLYAEESKVIDGLQLYRYREDPVCKFFAQVLLHSAGKFNLAEFLQAWKESVPEGMEVCEGMLNGIAIVDRKSMPNVIWAFPEEHLPENIVDRFKVLFETKEKWTVPEIAPYIRRLANDKIDVNALLAKHARVSTSQGVKYYSSKHGK